MTAGNSGLCISDIIAPIKVAGLPNPSLPATEAPGPLVPSAALPSSKCLSECQAATTDAPPIADPVLAPPALLAMRAPPPESTMLRVLDTAGASRISRLTTALELVPDGDAMQKTLGEERVKELVSDGWDDQTFQRVTDRVLGPLRVALAGGGDLALRVVRRCSILARVAADVYNKTGQVDTAASGVISCPLPLPPQEAVPVARRTVTICGSPRHECLARVPGASKQRGWTNMKHCFKDGEADVKRSRAAAGIQVRPPLPTPAPNSNTLLQLRSYSRYAGCVRRSASKCCCL